MAASDYLDPYRAAARAHGHEFEVTLWANRETQVRRFDVMAQLVALGGRRVLDVGCGRGDFAVYLLEQGIRYERFIGLDGVEQVISYAESRELPRSRFIHGDALVDPALLETESPEVICISGTLNTMTLKQAQWLLERSWGAAERGLVFNFLSDRTGPGAPPQLGPARRLPTLKLLDWAIRHTPCVAFRQDYFEGGHDATIAMHRPESCSLTPV